MSITYHETLNEIKTELKTKTSQIFVYYENTVRQWRNHLWLLNNTNCKQ